MMQSTETVWSFANMGPLHIQDSQHKRRLCPSMDEEEDMVEEGCQYHVGEKKRRLTSEQVKFLEQSFEMENNLEPERKLLIAKHLKLQPRQVAVWFQNRRARWKTKQLEHNFDVLKASYDAILKDNEKLQAEVNALNALLNGSNIKKSSSVQDTISSVLPAINTHPSSHPQAAEKSEDISSKIEVDSPTKSEQSEVADSSCDVSASEPSALRLIEDSNSAFYSEGLLENLYNPGLLPQVAVKVEENLFQEDNCERLFSWEEPGLFFWCD